MIKIFVSGQWSEELEFEDSNLPFPILREGLLFENAYGERPTGNRAGKGNAYSEQSSNLPYPAEYNLPPLKRAIAIIVNLYIPLSAQNLRYHCFKGIGIKLLCGLLLEGV